MSAHRVLTVVKKYHLFILYNFFSFSTLLFPVSFGWCTVLFPSKIHFHHFILEPGPKQTCGKHFYCMCVLLYACAHKRNSSCTNASFFIAVHLNLCLPLFVGLFYCCLVIGVSDLLVVVFSSVGFGFLFTCLKLVWVVLSDFNFFFSHFAPFILRFAFSLFSFDCIDIC